MQSVSMPQTEAALARIKDGLDEKGLIALDRELSKAAVKIGASLFVSSGKQNDIQPRRHRSR